MADDRMALLATMRKAGTEGDADFLRQSVQVLAEAVMEAEVTELTGVPHGVRDPEQRLTQRNGYRERRWDTRVGTIGLSIPRVRDGSYFPSLLEPRRRAERALLAVVQEAYVLGVSTRRVEDLVETLGISGLSKSQVSRICAALDAEVETFRHRSLAGETYPYLWLDATYVKVRDGGRVVNMAALVATGVATSGERRILGLELAAGNDEGSAWAAFIRSLAERGLSGVRLVISDAHPGLVRAVHEQLLGAAWQRCRVHFTRNAQDLVPRSARGIPDTNPNTAGGRPVNDDRLLREVASWLVEADPEPPDAKTSVRQAMASAAQVRQRGRWWPLPIPDRTASRPTTDQSTKYEPSAIPATNGHTPTVTGRTQFMFSPVKAITAGALVFAIGGVMLIAQPFDQQASVPGAATDELGLVTEEVEPGVERIIRDDAGHDLDAKHPTNRYDMDSVLVTPDGTVWLSSSYLGSDNDVNAYGPLVWALGQPETPQFSFDVFCETDGFGVTCFDPATETETTYLADTTINQLALAPDGTYWAVGSHGVENGGLYHLTFEQ